MGKPDVVKIAETKVCGVPGCDGELKFSGLVEDMHPPRYPMICQKCGANNRYVKDLSSLVVGVKLDDIIPKEPEPEASAPDAPTDLVGAAKLLATALDRKVYIARKPIGSHGIKLPNTPTSCVWCITLEQDMYESEYCVYPDCTIKETEQYT